MPAGLLSLVGLGKQYDSKVAVHDLSLTIQPGEFVTLLGPSGCGKTTTLRMIAGFVRPTQGSITLDERVLSDAEDGTNLPPEQRDMGMVFQSYAVWPHMNVGANVEYPLKIKRLGRSERKQQVQQALSMVSLADYENRYPDELSGGQQQRVALARALVMAPRVLLLDEPLSNLDARLRETMRFEIVALQRRYNITIVYVTHDQAEALAMSDRIVVMNEGSAQQIDTPEGIYTQPQNRFVADFVGTANFLEATPSVSSSGTQTVTTADGVEWRLPAATNLAAGVNGALTLLLRPEDVRLVVPQDDLPAGVVKRRSFLGNTIDYLVQVGAVDLRVQTAPDVKFAVDESVSLQVQHATVLRD